MTEPRMKWRVVVAIALLVLAALAGATACVKQAIRGVDVAMERLWRAGSETGLEADVLRSRAATRSEASQFGDAIETRDHTTLVLLWDNSIEIAAYEGIAERVAAGEATGGCEPQRGTAGPLCERVVRFDALIDRLRGDTQ